MSISAKVIEYAAIMEQAMKLDSECRIRKNRIESAADCIGNLLVGNAIGRRIANLPSYIADITAATNGILDMAMARKEAIDQLYQAYTALEPEQQDLFKHPSVLKFGPCEEVAEAAL